MIFRCQIPLSPLVALPVMTFSTQIPRVYVMRNLSSNNHSHCQRISGNAPTHNGHMHAPSENQVARQAMSPRRRVRSGSQMQQCSMTSRCREHGQQTFIRQACKIPPSPSFLASSGNISMAGKRRQAKRRQHMSETVACSPCGMASLCRQFRALCSCDCASRGCHREV